jgi:hypothetical protein
MTNGYKRSPSSSSVLILQIAPPFFPTPYLQSSSQAKMILSLKTVALVALATAVTAAPVKRATNEQIIACFTG